MKIKLFLMALAGVALASCVNDEVADVSQKEQEKVKIVFDSPVLYANSDSRANVYGEISNETVEGAHSYPKEENFVIYAVSHSGDLTNWSDADAAAFNDEAISYDDNVDGWAPIKVEDNPDTEDVDEKEYYIWPSGKKMSFAACSPANLENSATRTYGADGLTIDGFTVNSDASKHYDLMYSQRICNKTSGDMNHGASYYSGIPILFHHALSSIRFSIANTSSETVVLNKIEVWGTQYKGTFKENVTDGATYSANPVWTLTDDRVAEDKPYVAFEGEVEFLYSARYVKDLATPTDVCNQLLLLPQTLTDNVKIKVSYTVNGEAHYKIVNIHDLVDENDIPVTAWNRGVRYTYRLFYSPESASKDMIYFSPSADDWEIHDVVVVNLL